MCFFKYIRVIGEFKKLNIAYYLHLFLELKIFHVTNKELANVDRWRHEICTVLSV